MNVPKKGDRIRVSDEGTVTRVYLMAGTAGDRTRLTVERDDGSTFFVGLKEGMKPKVEVVEPPLVIGGIYMDADNEIFRYNGTADAGKVWTEFEAYGHDVHYPEHYPNKPLRRLDGAK